MDRKELIVILLLAILVALLATVRLFHGPVTGYSLDREPVIPRPPGGREPGATQGSAADLAKRLQPFPMDRYTPRDPDARSMFEAAERIFAEALTAAANEPASSFPFVDAAITTYQNFRTRYEKEPATEVALLRVGQCYTAMKAYPEGARVFEHFLKTYPKSELRPMALLWIGDNRLRQGETGPAKTALEEVITQYPASDFAERAMLRIAQCYALMKLLPEAADAYDRFLKKYPASLLRPVALLGSSDLLLNDGKPDLAKARLEEVLRQNPSSPFAKIAEQRLGQLKGPPSK